MARTRRLRSLGLWICLLALVAGCELRVATEVVVERDGSGTVGLVFVVDEGLLAELDDAGVDPTAELAAAVAGTDGWQLRREAVDDGLRVTATYAAADTRALTAALSDLAAGLGPDDPALAVDLDLAVDAEGAAQLEGTASFRAPAGPGVVDAPGLPDGADMAALTAEHVTAELVVTLPGRPTTHDADVEDGRTLRWEVPADAEVAVTARAAAPSLWTPEVVAAFAAGILLVAVGGGVAWAWRRRGRS